MCFYAFRYPSKNVLGFLNYPNLSILLASESADGNDSSEDDRLPPKKKPVYSIPEEDPADVQVLEEEEGEAAAEEEEAEEVDENIPEGTSVRFSLFDVENMSSFVQKP